MRSSRFAAALVVIASLVVGCSRAPAERPPDESADATSTAGAELLHPARPAGEQGRLGSRAQALSTPTQTGFTDTAVISGLRQPVAVRFASNGSVFVAEKRGRILSYPSLGATTSTVVADLSTSVYDFWDRGLLGFAIDPGFPAAPYLYVLYTYDAAIGEVAPRWNDLCPNPPGATSDGCIASGRLSRLHVGADGVVDSEQVLIEGWPQQFPSHSIGDLAFGPDGALFASGGDGASFTFTDYGQNGTPENPLGDPPVPIGTAQTAPGALGGALRSQSLRRAAGLPVVLNGSVIRVDPATGLGIPGNATAGHADPNARRIVGYGLRNPFRMTVRPGTSELWVGDVGWNAWEEIDRIVDPSAPTTNFGWPCYEGAGRQGGYDGANLDACETLYAAGPAAWTQPYFTYNHGSHIVPGETCGTGSSSISGLAFYTGTQYPERYRGALVWGDHSRACIWAMLPGSDGLPDPANQQVFVTGAPLVSLTAGPDGDLFYSDYDHGEIHRLAYRTPTAVMAATPTAGAAPLTVSFDATGSAPGIPGEALTFAWDLDGDGTFGDATGATASFVYPSAGTYHARLRVTDPRGGVVFSDPVTIAVDAAVNTPPRPVIDAPTAAFTWAVGDAVAFSGRAEDTEDGALPPAALSWRVVMQHCPSNCHSHEVQTLDGVASGSFPAPDHDYPSYLELVLTATDSAGAQASTSVRIDPRTVALRFESSPTGLQLAFGASQDTTPFTRTVIQGSANSIGAPTPQTSGAVTYDFSAWSDGAAAAHDIVAGADTTLRATFAARPRGLLAQYFDGPNFTGTVLTRVDPTVDFDWGRGSPDPSMGPDTFSVRWVGQIEPRFSETYTFYTTSDDGVRLRINGTLVVDNWTLHAKTENRGTIALQAGHKYDIVMEFYENGGYAVAQLGWSSSSQPREIVPAAQLSPTPTQGLRGEYFDQADLTASRLVRLDPGVDFDWGSGSPDPLIAPDTFSVRWSGQLRPRYSEVYVLRTVADDGMRLWLDGTLLIDGWNDAAPTERTATLALQAGRPYDLVVEYREGSGSALARLLWSSPSQPQEVIPASQLSPYTANPSFGTGTGLTGQYFGAPDLTAPVLTRVDPGVAFDWGNGAPAPGVAADRFSVRWTGQVQPRFSETYSFVTTSDDGVRLWVNGTKVIDDWTLHSAREDTGRIALQAGQKYDIVLEFFENKGQAVAKLEWSSTSQPRQVIPATQLYPAP